MAYTLQGRKCGTVRFNQQGTVITESKTMSGKLTSYPIEEGSKISDHFERDPVKGSLRGVLIGGGAAVATLESMCKSGDLLTYEGSYRMTDIVITQLDFSTDSSNRSGFSFTASFQRAEIVGAQYVPIGAEPLMSDQDKGKSGAAQGSGKPAQDGLQTTASQKISNSAYADYINTFNNKSTPSKGPLSRSTPTYTGFRQEAM